MFEYSIIRIFESETLLNTYLNDLDFNLIQNFQILNLNLNEVKIVLKIDRVFKQVLSFVDQSLKTLIESITTLLSKNTLL